MPDDYRVLPNGMIHRTRDNATIPNDKDNADFQEYERWKKAGGVAEEVREEPSPVDYLRERDEAYRDELGVTSRDELLDVVIGQVDALRQRGGGQATPEFQKLLAIRERHPKPSHPPGGPGGGQGGGQPQAMSASAKPSPQQTRARPERRR